MRRIGIAAIAAVAFGVGLWIGSDDQEAPSQKKPEVTALEPASAQATPQPPAGRQARFRPYPAQEQRMGGGPYKQGGPPAPRQDSRAAPEPGVAYQYDSRGESFRSTPYGGEPPDYVPVDPSKGSAYRDPYLSPYASPEPPATEYRFRPLDEERKTKRWTGNFPAPASRAPGSAARPGYAPPYPMSPGPSYWRRNSSPADSTGPLWAIQL